MSESTIEGIDELIAKLKELEVIPQTIVTSAAKKGANMALKYALDNLQPVNQQGEGFLGRYGRKEQHAPGTLKNVLKLTRESSKKGKCVYKIDTTWYAHFIDLGFTDRKGIKWDGSHFLKFAMTKHYEEIRDAIISDLSNGIDKVVGRSGV